MNEQRRSAASRPPEPSEPRDPATQAAAEPDDPKICIEGTRRTGDMKDHEYFVYIMCSQSGTLYIGMTNSILRRALQHKRGEIEGFSGKYHCDRLVYYESFDDVHRAIGREKQLK